MIISPSHMSFQSWKAASRYPEPSDGRPFLQKEKWRLAFANRRRQGHGMGRLSNGERNLPNRYASTLVVVLTPRDALRGDPGFEFWDSSNKEAAAHSGDERRLYEACGARAGGAVRPLASMG